MPFLPPRTRARTMRQDIDLTAIEPHTIMGLTT